MAFRFVGIPVFVTRAGTLRPAVNTKAAAVTVPSPDSVYGTSTTVTQSGASTSRPTADGAGRMTFSHDTAPVVLVDMGDGRSVPLFAVEVLQHLAGVPAAMSTLAAAQKAAQDSAASASKVASDAAAAKSSATSAQTSATTAADKATRAATDASTATAKATAAASDAATAQAAATDAQAAASASEDKATQAAADAATARSEAEASQAAAEAAQVAAKAAEDYAATIAASDAASLLAAAQEAERAAEAARDEALAAKYLQAGAATMVAEGNPFTLTIRDEGTNRYLDLQVPQGGGARTIADIPGLQDALDAKAESTHNHDDAYAKLTHGHSIADVAGLQAALDDKAQASHTHTTTQVAGLDAALASKAPSSHTHTTAQVTGLDAALAGKAPAGHTHAVADLTATGTRSSSTFLRGDGTWATPPAPTVPPASLDLTGTEGGTLALSASLGTPASALRLRVDRLGKDMAILYGNVTAKTTISAGATIASLPSWAVPALPHAAPMLNTGTDSASGYPNILSTPSSNLCTVKTEGTVSISGASLTSGSTYTVNLVYRLATASSPA